MDKKTQNNQRIEVTKDGPFRAKNIESFVRSDGSSIPVKDTMVLCRCGASKNKPFCDGSHVKAGFSGGKADDRVPDKTERYDGASITIYDNRGVCSHRGYCTEELPEVFQTDGSEPWINPDGATVDEIIHSCEKCPSGALSYSMPGSERIQNVEIKPKIAIAPKRYGTAGPYDITGAIDIVDPEGLTSESDEHYTLCRCGASKNKPFCSGEHWHVDFQDDANSGND